jgi:segregation and condensation protein A
MTELIQQKLPLGFLNGEAVTAKPDDLYIPPDALEVALEAFEGPLDLLLYLIKKHKLDILELSVSKITHQYMQYVEMMSEFKLELAADYLVMAALLAQIKSRFLLPVHKELEDEHEDPRALLIKQLQEYEQFKKAAEKLDTLPRVDRDIYIAKAQFEELEQTVDLPQLCSKELLTALSDIMARAETLTHHHISAETLSTRARMSYILTLLNNNNGFIPFANAFERAESKAGVVVSFIAVLELVKEGLIQLQQSDINSLIYLKLK